MVFHDWRPNTFSVYSQWQKHFLWSMTWIGQWLNGLISVVVQQQFRKYSVAVSCRCWLKKSKLVMSRVLLLLLTMHKREQPDVDKMWHDVLTNPLWPSITKMTSSLSSPLVQPSCDTFQFCPTSCDTPKSDTDGALLPVALMLSLMLTTLKVSNSALYIVCSAKIPRSNCQCHLLIH